MIGTCVSYDEGEASRRVAYIVEYDESDQGFFYVVSGPNGGHRKRVCHGDVAMEEDVREKKRLERESREREKQEKKMLTPQQTKMKTKCTAGGNDKTKTESKR